MNSLSFSQTLYKYNIFFAYSLRFLNLFREFTINPLWIHSLFRKVTINSLSFSRICYDFTIFFSQIHYKFTLCFANLLWFHFFFANSLWIHFHLFRELWWLRLLRKATINSLSVSRNEYWSIICFGNSLWIDRFFAKLL